MIYLISGEHFIFVKGAGKVS